MARRRLGVVLLVPAPQSIEIDGLRRGCGDAMLERVAPHITLVPPVNLAADALPDALTVLRAAAHAMSRPLTLSLGPPTTFAPVSPTLYLAVADPADAPGELDRLHELQEHVFAGPFERSLTHSFVPHVTVLDNATPEQLAACEPALASYRTAATFASVHVLQEHRDDDGIRRWRPLADVVFEPPAVVARGGLPAELFTSTVLGPEEGALWAALVGEPAPGPPGGERVIVTARRDHEVLGVACATLGVDPAGSPTARIDGVVVERRHQRQGTGRVVLDGLEYQLRLRGVRRAEASVLTGASGALFASRGWEQLQPGRFGRSWD